MTADQASGEFEHYEALLARDPDSRAFGQLAEIYRRRGRTAEAIALCDHGLQRYPAYVGARLTLARALAEHGDLGRAEAEFRRGATLLNQGRAGEAEESFGTALSAYPGHEAARQALVAMHLEQRRIDEARRLLQEGVALNPANARFASVLARIFIERQDYAAALEVVNGVRVSEQASPELQSARGTALQRLGRHAEAADAFQASLRSEPQNGAAWVGFGISLESLGRKSEAAEAFRRAAATGTLSTEVRGYAEQRARQLQ